MKINCERSILSEQEQPFGVWGMRHRDYPREHKRAVHAELLLTGKLNSYLANIDRQSQDMFLQLIDQMAAEDGLTEQLKAEDQMEWVGRMDAVREMASEIVYNDLIHA